MSDIEKQVLSCFVKDPLSIDQAISRRIDTEFFEIPECRKLYEILHWYYLKYRGIPSEEGIKQLVELSKKTTDDIKQRIILLFSEVVATTVMAQPTFLLDQLVRYFKENELRRALMHGATLLKDGDIDKALLHTKEHVSQIESRTLSYLKEASLTQNLNERASRYEMFQTHPHSSTGVMIGFPTIDRVTNGMKPGWLVVSLGANKSGKSTLLLNMAVNAWQTHKNVLFISLEIPKEQFEIRFDSYVSGIPYDKIANGQLQKEELEFLKGSLDKQKANPGIFYVMDTIHLSASILASYLKRLPHKFDLVVIDYLGLMKADSTRGTKDWENISNIGLEIRQVAREFEVPILTAMQVNRDALKGNGAVFNIENIALSYMLTCHADLIMSLKVKDREEQMQSGTCDLTGCIAASRVSGTALFDLEADFTKLTIREKIRRLNMTPPENKVEVKRDVTIEEKTSF